MSVNPGWGGQSFIDGLAGQGPRRCGRSPPGPRIEIDGGIDPATAPAVAEAGATLFVAGSAIFGKDDPAAAYAAIAAAAGRRARPAPASAGPAR